MKKIITILILVFIYPTLVMAVRIQDSELDELKIKINKFGYRIFYTKDI